METIITAIITGLCVAIPSVWATLSSNKQNQKLTEYKIQELTEHVNRHNNLIDRMYEVERRVTLLEDKEK